MSDKKHLLYRIRERKGGLVFWSALPPQGKSEMLMEKRMLPVKESLRLSVSPTDVEFIKRELKGFSNRKKKRLKRVM